MLLRAVAVGAGEIHQAAIHRSLAEIDPVRQRARPNSAVLNWIAA